jgi:uncharacterized protein YaaN involved in tellurite resistance
MSSKMEEAFQNIMKKIEEIEINHQEYRAKLENISIRIEKEANETEKRIKQFETICVHNSILS